MVTTYKHGLRFIAASVLAASLSSCTYDENDLRGVDAAGPVEAGSSDTTVSAVDAGIGLAIEAGALDSGKPQDLGGGDTQIDAPTNDAGVDIRGAIDAASLDGQPIDTQGPDVPISITPIDAAAVDVSPSEAGRIDSSRG